MRRKLVAGMVALVGAGCVPAPGRLSTARPCSSEGKCAESYVCVDNLCVPASEVGDAASGDQDGGSSGPLGARPCTLDRDHFDDGCVL